VTLAIPSLAAPQYSVLHAFGNGNDGGGVWGSLAFDGEGNAYGTTSGGGAYGYGTVFRLEPRSKGNWKETILYSFCAQSHCPDGASPMSTPVFDAAGSLFATTSSGGPHNFGTTFELTSVSGRWTFSPILDVGARVGLAIDRAGNLYEPSGPGKYKAGDILELSLGSDGWTAKVVYNFTAKNGDCCPSSALTLDSAGNLYGTTMFGGIGDGTAYKIVRRSDGTGRERRLHNFLAGSDGQYPQSGLVLDQAGNVYGTTLQGGISGTVFELSPQKNGPWKERILYDFPNAVNDGGAPVGKLVFDQVGNLYGTASAGGNACSCGVIFKLTPTSNGKWKYTVLHRFTGRDGNGPGDLIIDSKGNLYGTAVAGGIYGYGVAFELTP
jgi:uncharacterized repeat protein (TIGR03803 family)